MSEKICFIVTAIGESGTPTRERADNVYRYLIAPVCEELGYKPVRVDHVNAVDNINATIINYLKTAPMVIADMTDHNPNAFYELGFRQALELPLVPIIKVGERLPFDVMTTRTVFYDTDVSKIEESKENLKSKIQSFKNFEMPESRIERSLTLDDLNDNLTKKLNKILNLLEKQQSYSSLVHTHDFDFKSSKIDYQSILQQIQDKTNQSQRNPLFPEDKK
nr:MAG TPA: CMP/hydroxymethyl CMP hydrolase [Caudoviricetes sp.]DAX98789.1 MAG TPA: CMP/hydroxymethyl CMP hydrolase [Caudoviricetes sp.]